MSHARPTIAYVIASYPPVIGGAELQAHRVATLLADDFDVHVFTGALSTCPSSTTVDGVRVHRVPVANRPGFRAALGDATSLLMHGVSSRRLDLVQGFQLGNVAFAAATTARVRRVPLALKVTHRDNLEHLPTARHRRQVAVLIRSAQALVAPSLAVLTVGREHGLPADKLVYIPNGVDCDHFSPPDHHTRTRLRAALGYTDEHVVFAWVGRLDPFKNLSSLLPAWGRVEALRPQARLLLVGDGEDEAAADLLVRSFPRTVTRFHLDPDVRWRYWAADSLVLTTRAEGLSNTLLEALSCGLGAVVSNAPENVEVDGGDDIITVYDRTRDGALEEALVRAVDDHEQQAARSERGRRRIASAYSLRATAMRWADLYRTLIPQSRPPRDHPSK